MRSESTDYTPGLLLVDSGMRTYQSTRGGSSEPLAVALERGLAPDGGLYVPSGFDPFGVPPGDAPASFLASARWAAPTLIPDVDPEILEHVLEDALDFPLRLVEVEPNLHVLELFHGPTHAFKDVGARVMARLMAAILPHDGERTVLVATSGDTGGAVAAAFHRVEGFRVVVLFPREGVSARQRRQMTTLGGNVLPLAVEGTFDDCQRLAKTAFLDRALSKRLRLTSANSINIGRLLPQALYYVHAALLLGWSERRARYVVPSGNLGNLCAGLIAERCGMPTAGFVAATNVNDGFVRFLETDHFEARPSIRTASNAMDVGAPSNLERIQWLFRDMPGRMRDLIRGAAASDATTAETIRSVFERTGYTMDPHTAVAYHAATGGPHEPRSSEEPVVVLATAHPAKFPEIVEAATGRAVELPEGLRQAMERDEHFETIRPSLLEIVSAVDEARRHPSGSPRR